MLKNAVHKEKVWFISFFCAVIGFELEFGNGAYIFFGLRVELCSALGIFVAKVT